MQHGVIFDMDGVLFDSHPAHKEAWRAFLGSVGRAASESELEIVRCGMKRDNILRHFLGDLGSAQLSELGRRKDELFSQIAEEVPLVEGVGRFLTLLEHSGIPKAVATSASSGRAQAMLRKNGMIDRFVTVVTGSEVPRGKPDPALFRKAGLSLGVAPERILVIEDAVAGVQAATAAGMRSLGIADGSQAEALLAAGALRVVPDFRSLTLADFEELFLLEAPSGARRETDIAVFS